MSSPRGPALSLSAPPEVGSSGEDGCEEVPGVRRPQALYLRAPFGLWAHHHGRVASVTFKVLLDLPRPSAGGRAGRIRDGTVH